MHNLQDHVDPLHIYMKGMGYKIVIDLLCMDMLHMVVLTCKIHVM